MDFRAVTKTLVAAFEAEGVAYALIGGYAVGLWGAPRATVDMDFLVRREDMGKVNDIMQSLTYEVAFTSENVTQYVSPLTTFGEIDFLHAFRRASLGMLSRAELVRGYFEIFESLELFAELKGKYHALK